MAVRDPFRNFKFDIEIDGFTRKGFQKISGLKETTEIIEYREGGDNESPFKIPGQTTFDNVTCERGMALGGLQDLVDWRRQIFQIDSGGVNPPEAGEAGAPPTFRRNVQIYLKNKSGDRVWKWELRNAWPSELEYEGLDASANDILIERLVLAHEGMVGSVP